MLDFANAIDCPRGIVLSGMTQDGLTVDEMNANLRTAFGQAAEMAEKAGVTLVIELAKQPG